MSVLTEAKAVLSLKLSEIAIIKMKIIINVLIMLLVSMTLNLKAQRVIDELIISTDGGYYNMNLDAQISIYDSSATGYPYTTNYSSFSINNTNNWKFNFVGNRAGAGNGTVGYTVYKLIVHDNGEKIVYIDYRDCEYQDGDPNNNYNTADMYIRYFHNSEYRFQTKNYSTGLWEPIINDTVKIWENGRKTPESSVGTSCFGIPNIPTNFNLTNYLGNPQLTWSANSEYDIDGYEVWRKLDSGNWSLRTTVSHPTTSYTDIWIEILPGRNCYRAYYKINAKDWGNNTSGYTYVKSIRYGGCFGLGSKELVASEEYLPESFSLSDNYPNPFNPTTTIKYELPEPSYVSLVVYDLMGHEVIKWQNDYEDAGFRHINWDGTNANGMPVPSGVYIYRLTARSMESDQVFTQSRKMVLLK